MIVMKRNPVDLPGDIELSLPWFVTGQLNAAETRRVRAALARDPELARDYAAAREEYRETALLHDALGGPSPRAMQTLFAAIESEPRRARPQRTFASWLPAALSPSVLTWVAAAALLVLLVQAAAIGLKIL